MQARLLIRVTHTLFFFCVIALLVAAGAQAQPVSDFQTFTVQVPGQFMISAPASVSIAHDDGETDQVFPVQQWDIKSRARSGATVVFTTDQAFTHTADATYKSDAILDLVIASSRAEANWIVTTALDQTDYAGFDEVAAVQATSTRAGEACFDLTVTFVTENEDALAEGDYSLTVTGTLTAN